MNRYTLFARGAAVVALSISIACTGTSGDSAPAVSGGGSGGGGGGGGGGRGRGSPSVVLAPTDVHTVTRGILEATTAISGDLRPIEEIGIRARIEGDVLDVRVREGDPVKLGAVLARFDTSELDAALSAAQADLAAAKSDAATADWNAEQSRELFKAGAISEQALKAAEQAALAARARQSASDSRLQTATLSLKYALVVAPATGTISQRLVQTGERAARGAQLFLMVRDDTLEFTAALPARSAALARPGQEVRFTVDGRDHIGRVARVSPSIDPASRSVAVYIRVPNREHDLKANAFAAGRIVSSERSGVITIPVSAIRRSRQEDAAFVYRIEGDQIAIAAVKLGDTDEARGVTEVLDGLSENDRVVIGNVGTIGRGMKVQILNGDDVGGRNGGRAGRGGRGGRGNGRGGARGADSTQR